MEVLGGLWSSVLLKADTATRSHQGLGALSRDVWKTFERQSAELASRFFCPHGDVLPSRGLPCSGCVQYVPSPCTAIVKLTAMLVLYLAAEIEGKEKRESGLSLPSQPSRSDAHV